MAAKQKAKAVTMAKGTLARGFEPNWSTHPGEHLQEYLALKGWSQAEFARLSGLTPKLISEIINGKNPVTPETAIIFERVLGLKAYIWTGWQASWDQFQARRAAQKKAAQRKDWLRQHDYKTLQKLGILPNTKDWGELVDAFLSFLGIGTPEALEARLKGLAIQYRQSSKHRSEPGNILAWHMLGEHAVRSLDLPPYNKVKFEAAVREIRSLTLLPASEFQPRMRQLCHEAGAALVFIEPLKATALFGAARWLAPDRPLIQMSLRMKTNDHFWWTFFHEAGHILLHEGRNFADDESAKGEGAEAEADAFAEELLYGRKRLAHILEEQPRSEQRVREIAKELGLHPGIVAGMLQHYRVIPFSHLNKLKARLDFPKNSAASND